MKTMLYVFLLVLAACHGQGNRGNGERVVTDALGRVVALPDTVCRVVCIRSSAIRLVTYAGGAHLICGVEEQETRDDHEFTHLFAHPELLRKPVIGPRMGGDAELMMQARPDVIFMASTTIGEADELQRRTGIPVFAIEYGDIGRRRTVFYRSLRQIGEVLHTERRVDTLIGFVNAQLADLRRRTQGVEERQSVYVGGISYKGQKGLTSTDPYYAAMDFIGTENVASKMDSAYVSPITGAYIDWEQLMEWNPDVIFVDVSGWPLVQQEFQNRSGVCQVLKAFRTKRIYLLWPYNNYHSNFDVMLVNAWYTGKVLFPERFADVSLVEKTNEIMNCFVGDTIADDLVGRWGNCKNVFDTLNGWTRF